MAEEKILSKFTQLPEEIQEEILKMVRTYYNRAQEKVEVEYYCKILTAAALSIFKNKQETDQITGFTKTEWADIEQEWSNYILSNYKNEIIFDEQCSYYRIERVYRQKKARGLKINNENEWIEIFKQFLYYGRIVSDQVQICVDDLSVAAATIYNYENIDSEIMQNEWYNYIVFNHPELKMASNEKYYHYKPIYEHMGKLLGTTSDNEEVGKHYSIQEAADIAVTSAFYTPLTVDEQQKYYHFNLPEQIIEYKKMKKLPEGIPSNSDLYYLKDLYNKILNQDWNNYWTDYIKYVDTEVVYPKWNDIIQLAWSDTQEALYDTEWYFSEQIEVKFETPGVAAAAEAEANAKYKFEVIEFNKQNIVWKLTSLDSEYGRTDRRSWINIYEKDALGKFTVISSASNGRNLQIDLINDEKPAYVKEKNVIISQTLRQEFSEDLQDKKYQIKCAVAYSYGKLSTVFNEKYFLYYDIVGDSNKCIWTPKEYYTSNFWVGLPRQEVVDFMYHDFNYGLVDMMYQNKLLTYEQFEMEYKKYCLNLKSGYTKEYLHYFPFYEPMEMWGSLNKLKILAEEYAHNAYKLGGSNIYEVEGENKKGKWVYDSHKGGWYQFKPETWKVSSVYQEKKEISDFTYFLNYFKEKYGEEGIAIWSNLDSSEFIKIAGQYFMKHISTISNLDPLHNSPQVYEYSIGRIYNPYNFSYGGKNEIDEDIILDTSKWLDLTSYDTILSSSQYRVLYPPILESSQPAFSIEDNTTYKIYFKLSEYTDFNSVGHVSFRIVKQSDSTSVVNTSKWYDGIIYVPRSQITKEGVDLYSATIVSGKQSKGRADLIHTHWANNTYYKIQARLGTNASMWTTDKNKDTKEQYIAWRDIEMSHGRFSDWSTTMVIKAIPKPKVSILNKEENQKIFEINNMYNIEYTSSPIFYGFYDSQSLGESQHDNLYEYKFDLYYQGTLLETSGWNKYINYLTANEQSVTIKHRFLTSLNMSEEYEVFYLIKTTNGYEGQDNYSFRISENFLDYFGPMEDVRLTIDADEEEGVNLIYFNSGYYIENYVKVDNGISGNFIITRRKAENSVWEDLYYFTPDVLNSIYTDELIYKDFTIESGIKYQYGIQKEYGDGTRSKRIESNYIICNFEHCYLYCDDIQLKLKFNMQLDSFKYNIMAQKQDTLGGKYPNILINGQSYYAEFPINALVSLHSDENFNFFKNKHDGLYYDNKLIIPYEKYRKEGMVDKALSRNNREDRAEVLGQEEFLTLNTFNTDLTSDNIFIERKFREKVEEFLNNGKPKLFKSATEGNFIVSLLNIGFLPINELGRALYSVQGTAYEIAENTLNNLVKYNIWQKGEFNPYYNKGISLVQLKGYYTNNTNLIKEIADNLTSRNYSDVGLNLASINQLGIEHYPKIDLNNEINKIKYEISITTDTEIINELNYELQNLTTLQEKLAENIQYEPIEVQLNNNQMILNGHLPYNTKAIKNQNINQFYILDDEVPAVPIIANVATDIIYSAINYFGLSTGWGSEMFYQFKGNLVKPDSIKSILYFDYDFENQQSRTFKYVNDMGEQFYNTLNLFEVLKYELKEHIASRLNIRSDMLTKPSTEDYKLYLEKTKVPVWEYKTKGETYFISIYNLDGIYLEALTGTHFQYTRKNNESNIVSDFVIGNTGSLVLDPIVYDMFYENENFNAIPDGTCDYVPVLLNLKYTINIVKKVGG